MQQKVMALPALRISAATTELVKGILALYPQASIIPRLTPLEDEDISVEVQLPVIQEELYAARDRIHELAIQLQEQYDVLILASAVPHEPPSLSAWDGKFEPLSLDMRLYAALRW